MDDNNQSPKTEKTQDNIKPNLYSKIIDLRNIQLELKCQSDIEEIKTAEVEKAKENIKEKLANMIFHRKMLFTYLMYSNIDNQEFINSSFINSLFRDIAKNNPTPLSYHLYDGGYSIDFSEFTSSTQKLQIFAKNCVSYAQDHPDKIDQLTFSVIPAFFEYFWCEEVNMKFREFISFSLDIDHEIANKFSRVIFVSTELFYGVFDLFIKSEDQIPKFVNKSFLQENDIPNVEICNDIFNLKANSQENRNKNHLTANFCSSKISEIAELNDCFFFFTESDLRIVSYLLKSDNQLNLIKSSNNDFIVYQFEIPSSKPFTIPFSNSVRPKTTSYNQPIQKGIYSVSLKRSTDIFKKASDETTQFSMIYSESFDMSFLRKLLIKFPTIQIIAANKIEDVRISTILARQVCLARDEDRLLLEKQIEQLRKIENEEGNASKWQIIPTTQRLRDGITERCNHFQKVISKISKLQNLISRIENQSIKVKNEGLFFREKIELNIIKKWEKTNEFSSAIKNFQKLPKSSKFDKDNIKLKTNFATIWKNFSEDFNIYLSRNGYAINFPDSLLHDKLLSIYSFSDFLKEKEVSKKESEFVQLIQKQKNELIQYCNSGYRETISKEEIISNVFFIEKLNALFNSALIEQTPVKQILSFIKLFKFISLVFTQLFHEINNDDGVLKLFVLYLFSLGKQAGKLKSSFDYISMFLWFDDQNQLNEEIFGNNYPDASNVYNLLSQSISIAENLESVKGKK